MVSFLKVAKSNILLCIIVSLLKVAKVNFFSWNTIVSVYVLYIFCICHDISDKSWLPYQNLNCVLLVHLWIRSVKELWNIWKIFLILMIRKGNYQCCIVVWRVYHPFVTIMNELTVTHVLYLIETVSAQSTGACGYCLSEKEFDNI